MGKRCSEVREHLAAYSLGALDASVRRMVDKHLDSCPDCRAELVEYLQVADGLLESAPAVTPPAGLRARLIKEISGNQLAAEPGRHWLGKLPWNVAGALAIGLLLVLNLSLLT